MFIAVLLYLLYLFTILVLHLRAEFGDCSTQDKKDVMVVTHTTALIMVDYKQLQNFLLHTCIHVYMHGNNSICHVGT